MNYTYKNDAVYRELHHIEPTVSLTVESEQDMKIEQLIREKYSLSQEIALHRKKLIDAVEPQEWDDYNNYVIECIAKAREER